MNEAKVLMAVEELNQAFEMLTDAKQTLYENGIDTISYEFRDDALTVHVFCGLEELWTFYGPDTYEEKKSMYTEKGFTVGNVKFFALADNKGNYRKANVK